ncbi:MAG TPA: peptidylprolyl isomerase [Steroidobacteraceae bacterium]|nr:peptidylprolyl isomerase [Steroidobacteraceae bacterium]
MKERVYGFLLVAPLLLLAACGKSNSPVAAEPTESVATVNGKAISKADFDKYVEDVQRQAGQQLTPEQRSKVLDQYISLRLAADAAEKDGMAKKPEVAKELEQARMNVLVDAELKKYLDEHPVTDADLKPEYDAQVAAMPHEYHARHILVDDKATADQITKDLKGGADFAKVAAQKSKDPSGKNGGDLGWFTPDSMVKPFADAVVALKPGQMTDEPVQSQFGWHIIKLEESRASSPPAFDDVKDRVRQMVQRKRVQTYLEELRKNAKIEKKI